MLRCTVSFVVAAYDQVRRTPHDLRALPAELFTQSSSSVYLLTFFTRSSCMAAPIAKPFFLNIRLLNDMHKIILVLLIAGMTSAVRPPFLNLWH